MEYINNELCLGPLKKPLSALVKDYSSPLYVYDLDSVRDRAKEMAQVLNGVKLFYAVKANSNIGVLKCIKEAVLGADVVSLGEIRRSMEAGFSPSEIIYSGVGKTETELGEAIRLGIYQINVESISELHRIGRISQQMGRMARVALRLNPDIDIQTHPYIATGLRDNKFGIEISLISLIKSTLKNYSGSIELVGISLHLGSMMMQFEGFAEALRKLKAVYVDLKFEFPTLNRFDFGGGVGIFYEKSAQDLEGQLLKEYANIVFQNLKDLGCELQSEPGRWLVAHSGVLLTQVQYIKQTSVKKFVIVDSGMNHLVRPALYNATHRILPLKKRTDLEFRVDVVGPVCESADFFAKDRSIPEVEEGDFLAVLDVGAYGYTMANNYNLLSMPIEKCI